MTYLDTSALIKRFVPEKGSPLVRALVRTDVIETAKIAYARSTRPSPGRSVKAD